MSYAIVPEVPLRGARFAVRPLTIFLGWLIIGTFPALVWMSANAFFLRCRDAWRQAVVALAAFVILRVITLGLIFEDQVGALSNWFGDEGALVRSLAASATMLIVMAALAWMSGRQAEMARYQAHLMRRENLPWGLPALAVLAAVNILLVPRIDAVIPYFERFWGRLM